LRGYVQLSTAKNPGAHIALKYPDGTAILDNAGVQVYAYDNPHHLGPIINSKSGTAVRVKFSNYLPVGAGGELFIPVDTTITGAGVGPDGVTPYTQNRAVMHLVGGGLPWISAGNPHQWVAPAGVTNPAVDANGVPIVGGLVNARGVSTQNVPDMADPGPGSTTLYFPNDSSARFMFYHDRTSGLTRLNAYAGMEAGYLITDATETALVSGGTISGGALLAPVVVAAGTIPAAADTIPLIIEDKTFVPVNIAQQDAKWNVDTAGVAVNKWGVAGDLWFPHVYQPNQDPASAAGTSPVGRWDFGPLFWPLFPATNPLPSGNYGDATFIPEAYLDTPVINGTAYPTLTVAPKAYRFRILNASNDRYINLGLYRADLTNPAPQLDPNGNPIYDAAGVQQFFVGTEVKLVRAIAANAAGNPPVPVNTGIGGVAYDPTCLCQYPTLAQNNNVSSSGPSRAWPTDDRRGGVPDPTSVGPDIIAIGNDGGFLPNAVDIPSQPITYETNKRSITVNNAYGYGLMLGPAERSDAIIDFSAYAGQTLILYNDAPAPFPFSDERNDYYSGNPDLTTTGGAYSGKPGYGPNTRTMLQIKVSNVAPAAPFNVTALKAALPAAYAATQPAPHIPAVAYNTAFGTNDPDIYGHISLGSQAQPTLDFTTSVSNVVTLTGLKLVNSGGVINAAGIVVPNTGSGSGYNPASPPLVVFNNTVNGVICMDPAKGGVSASATVLVDPITRQVSQIDKWNPGSGYSCAPTVSFVNTSTLSSISVANGGSGYIAPLVEITGGGGTGALASATVGPLTSAAKIALVGGSGYTAPAVAVSGGGVAAGSVIGNATVGTSVATVSVIGGSGYVAPSVSYSGVGVGGAIITGGGTASVDPATGAILAVVLIPNTGFISAPTISITETDPVALATATGATATATVDPIAGSIIGITLTPNAGFTSAPIIDITDAAGTGLGATATATLVTAIGVVTGVTVTNSGTGYTSAPNIAIKEGLNTSATVAASLSANLGVGAQVSVLSAASNFHSIPVSPVSEQELFDDRGRYNKTGGVEMPFTNAINQTTVPLNYIDAATETIKDGEVQVWKISVNGLYSNSLSFNLADVQLLNRVGWDGTVKPPSSNEVGWKNTLRMNPLEDVVIAVRGKRSTIPFGLPASSRSRDPSKALGAAGSGLGFTVGQGVAVLTSAVNVGDNYDNEFVWNSAMLSNSEDDFMRPIVFHPTVVVPATPTGLADPMGDGNLVWIDPTPAGQIAVPAVPANPLAVPPVVGVPAITATLANPQNEIGFKMLKADIDAMGNLGALTPVLDVAGAPVIVPANKTGWTTPGLVPNVAYAVVAFNAAGDSLPSDPLSEKLPVAPTVFNYDPATLVYNSVTLTWSGGTASNKLELYRTDAATGVTSLVTTLAGSATGYVDKTVTAVKDYIYQIKAINALQPVAVGAAISAPLAVTTPMIPVTVPATVTATSNIPGTTITVKWTDSANNETAYQVDVSVDGAAYVAVPGLVPYTMTRTLAQGTAVAPNPLVPNVTLAPIFVPALGHKYQFRVTAINVSAAGAISTSAAALSPVVDLTAPVAPADPSGLSVLLSSATRATLSWTDNATTENSTLVTIVDNTAVPSTTTSVVVPSVGAAVLTTGTRTYTTPVATPLVAGHSYSFYVQAQATNFVVQTTKSNPSNTANLDLVVPALPTNVIATPGDALGVLTPGSITVTWAEVSNSQNGYTVQRSLLNAAGTVWGAWGNVGTVAANVNTITDAARISGRTYKYQVRANSALGNSGFVATTLLLTGGAVAP
jgi:FtsP/CotA-like multicopper oxidase with cupredoxin domain